MKEFGVRRLAFGVRRLAFSVWRSGIRRSAPQGRAPARSGVEVQIGDYQTGQLAADPILDFSFNGRVTPDRAGAHPANAANAERQTAER